MSEMQNTRMPGSSGGAESESPAEPGEPAGFAPEETARLLAARTRYEQGSLNEWTGDYKRLRFARWLYEHGQIDG